MSKILKKLCLLNFIAVFFVCLCCSPTFALKKLMITIVGDSAVGKSTISDAIVGGQFDHSDLTSLPTDSLSHYREFFLNFDDVEVLCRVNDCVGYQQGSAVPCSRTFEQFVADTDVFIIVFDVQKYLNHGGYNFNRAIGTWVDRVKSCHEKVFGLPSAPADPAVRAKPLSIILLFNGMDEGFSNGDPLGMPNGMNRNAFIEMQNKRVELFREDGLNMRAIFGSAIRNECSLNGIAPFRPFRDVISEVVPDLVDGDSLPPFVREGVYLTCSKCNMDRPSDAFPKSEWKSTDRICDECRRNSSSCTVM